MSSIGIDPDLVQGRIDVRLNLMIVSKNRSRGVDPIRVDRTTNNPAIGFTPHIAAASTTFPYEYFAIIPYRSFVSVMAAKHASD